MRVPTGPVRKPRSRRAMHDFLDILLPIIALIALGHGLARAGIITPAGETGLTQIVFYATTPALLFRAMAGATPALGDLLLLGAYFLPCLLVYAVWALLARRRVGATLTMAGLGAMGASFGNTVLLGVPIVERLHGSAGLRLLVIIVSLHSAVLFTLTTLLAEAERGQAQGGAALRATARMMARNPMVLALSAGAACGVMGLRLPGPLDAALALLGSATVPLALLAVGAGLAGFRLSGQWAMCAVVAAVKLAVLPFCVWMAGRFVFDLQPLALAVATLVAGLPTGTNVYVLASRYQIGMVSAAGAVLLSTLAAALSLPVLIALIAQNH